MKMTFRWYGSQNDSISLQDIKQIPAMSGLMGQLDKPAGALWPLEEIQAYIDEVHSAGLECEVIESMNIHEDIKLGLPSRDEFIDNYRQSIQNLAQCGIKVIIYNFMPVLDWLRTDLARRIPEDGSYSMYYDDEEIASMKPVEIVRKMAAGSNGFSLAGWEPERLAQLEKTLAQYQDMTEDRLRNHYKYFLDAVIPVCESVGVRMACHPDDPAWPIFNLPRIAHSQQDFEKILALHDNPCNAICLCTGSLGSNPENDMPSIIRHFGSQDRIAAMHVRNVKFLGNRCFRESSHLSADGDLDLYEIMRTVYEVCPDTYIRPDHGRMIWNEKGRPGYGLYDRALGAAYINGLWEAITKQGKEA